MTPLALPARSPLPCPRGCAYAAPPRGPLLPSCGYGFACRLAARGQERASRCQDHSAAWMRWADRRLLVCFAKRLRAVSIRRMSHTALRAAPLRGSPYATSCRLILPSRRPRAPQRQGAIQTLTTYADNKGPRSRAANPASRWHGIGDQAGSASTVLITRKVGPNLPS